MARFRIVSVEQNKFDRDHAPTDPNKAYGYWVSEVGSEWRTGSCSYYKELEPICQFFGREKPEDLTGLEFELPDGIDASIAIERLTLICRGGGTYVPPNAESLRERAVTALAKFELPDFSDVDSMTVSSAFAEGFGFFSPFDNTWLNSFCHAVNERSGGAVSIENANREEFTLTVRGLAVYLYLVRGDEKRRMTFGPYSTPFMFDPDREEFDRWLEAKIRR